MTGSRPLLPTLLAIGTWTAGNPEPGHARSLLSEAETAELATIATISRFKRGETIYRAGEPASNLYVLSIGLAKAVRTDATGIVHTLALLFDGDVLGLAEEGEYLNTTVAVTNLTAFRIPVSALRARMSHETGLDLALLTKAVHELRESQRHAFILGQRHIANRVAMFVQMLEQHQASRQVLDEEVYLAMTRKEIGEYLAATPAAVTRGFAALERFGVIRCRNSHHVKVLKRPAFEQVAAGLPLGPQDNVLT